MCLAVDANARYNRENRGVVDLLPFEKTRLLHNISGSGSVGTLTYGLVLMPDGR